jgi:hypothetical protein
MVEKQGHPLNTGQKSSSERRLGEGLFKFTLIPAFSLMEKGK